MNSSLVKNLKKPEIANNFPQLCIVSLHVVLEKLLHQRMVMIPICLQMRDPMLPVLLKLLSFYFKISIVLLLQTYASWLVSNGMLILCRIYTPSSKVTFVDCIHVLVIWYIPSSPLSSKFHGLYTIYLYTSVYLTI